MKQSYSFWVVANAIGLCSFAVISVGAQGTRPGVSFLKGVSSLETGLGLTLLPLRGGTVVYDPTDKDFDFQVSLRVHVASVELPKIMDDLSRSR